MTGRQAALDDDRGIYGITCEVLLIFTCFWCRREGRCFETCSRARTSLSCRPVSSLASGSLCSMLCIWTNLHSHSCTDSCKSCRLCTRDLLSSVGWTWASASSISLPLCSPRSSQSESSSESLHEKTLHCIRRFATTILS